MTMSGIGEVSSSSDDEIAGCGLGVTGGLINCAVSRGEDHIWRHDRAATIKIGVASCVVVGNEGHEPPGALGCRAPTHYRVMGRRRHRVRMRGYTHARKQARRQL